MTTHLKGFMGKRRRSAFLLVAVCLLISNFEQAHTKPTADDDDDNGLFLTPMIKSGQLDKARAAAQDNLKLAHVKTASNQSVVSYSDFITINEEFNSNLFFDYFPAMENPASAPLILSLNEFEGVSVMRNVFAETGPFLIGDNSVLIDNPCGWDKKYSVLYIDAPVGTGFSFTSNKNGEAQNEKEKAKEILAALTQILTLFTELQGKHLYLASETLGARVAAHLALEIENVGNLKVKLKGLFLGSPVFDSSNQLKVSDHLYRLGFVDHQQRDLISQNEEQISALINQNKLKEAVDLHMATRMVPNSLFTNLTGFTSFRNALHEKEPDIYKKYGQFLKTKELHNYLHVGLHKFANMDFDLFYNMKGFWLLNSVTKFEELLSSPGKYKILVYSGQFDLAIPHLQLYKMLAGLKWPGAAGFNGAPRTIKRLMETLGGIFSREVGSLMPCCGMLAACPQFPSQILQFNCFTISSVVKHCPKNKKIPSNHGNDLRRVDIKYI